MYQGEPLVKGKRVTGFTNEEEARDAGLTHIVPFLVEDELETARPLSFRKLPNWQPFSIVDGRLITGRNPRRYVYGGQVPANRPATDYTPRILPHRDGVDVPLEANQILWQR